MLSSNNKRSAIWKIDKEELKIIVKQKETFTEILNYFGLKMHGGNNRTLKERLKFDNIDFSHITQTREKRNKEHLTKLHKMRKIPLEEILVENSSYTKTYNLKKRLFKEGLLEEKCYSCGLLPFWNGKRLSLQLDHKNGNNTDNRLENLRLLCPNCHSQTETFAGKSLRKTFCKNKNCNNYIRTRSVPSKSGLCKECRTALKIEKEKIKSSSTNVVSKPKKVYYFCKSCSESITQKSKTGFCISCAAKNRDNLRQTKVQNRPSKEDLTKLILTKPFVQIGKDFGVSDNAVRKWCKSYDLPYRKKDIEQQRSQLEQMTEKELILT